MSGRETSRAALPPPGWCDHSSDWEGQGRYEPGRIIWGFLPPAAHDHTLFLKAHDIILFILASQIPGVKINR